MTEQALDRFLLAAPRQRLEAALDPALGPTLEAYFGKEALVEYQRLAKRALAPKSSHLSVSKPAMILFVPGVMGSQLFSRKRGGVWWLNPLTVKKVDQLGLGPDGGDADPQLEIEPFTTDPLYEPFTVAVQQEPGFEHELFPYDWRRPLSASTTALRDAVLALAKTHDARKVHLVAHSMGGLVVRAALREHQELWDQVDRIVFVGTPHYGAPAIASYLKNHLWGFELLALLGRYLSRDTFRTLQGVLTLLPAPAGIYPGTRAGEPHPCANFDLYDAASWKLGLTSSQTQELQATLDLVAKTHRELYHWHNHELVQAQRDRMLMIAGVGRKTLFRLELVQGIFRQDKTNELTRRSKCEPHREGDGRVPLASAELENVRTRYVKGLHGSLTNLPPVIETVFRWLDGKIDKIPLSDRCKGAFAKHLSVGQSSSALSHFDRSGQLVGEDDPGLWNAESVSEPRLDELAAKLAGGQLAEFSSVRLL